MFVLTRQNMITLVLRFERLVVEQTPYSRLCKQCINANVYGEIWDAVRFESRRMSSTWAVELSRRKRQISRRSGGWQAETRDANAREREKKETPCQVNQLARREVFFLRRRRRFTSDIGD